MIIFIVKAVAVASRSCHMLMFLDPFGPEQTSGNNNNPFVAGALSCSLSSVWISYWVILKLKATTIQQLTRLLVRTSC